MQKDINASKAYMVFTLWSLCKYCIHLFSLVRKKIMILSMVEARELRFFDHSLTVYQEEDLRFIYRVSI